MIRIAFALCAASFITGMSAARAADFRNFESPQINPLRRTPNGAKLLAANTDRGTLSVFDLADPMLPVLIDEIPVGIDPVSVNARTNDEVWVVNHVSDTVSIVSLSARSVIAVVEAKDEPSDVVFAGTPQRAFVSLSRRNQVLALDAVTRVTLATITIQGDQPRALAVSNDGTKVYVAAAISGNRTTCVPASSAPPPPAPTNPALPPAPQVGLIVDAADPAWKPSVIQYNVTDRDLFEIDVATLAVTRQFDRVGTINLGLAVSPTTGELFVTNTEARNLVRFEPLLRGHVVDNRLTRITTGPTPVVTAFDLNPGVDYSVLPNPTAAAAAIAQPAGIAFDPSGAHMWIASFGTDRVAKVSNSGAVLARVDLGDVSGATPDPKRMRGPRGVLLDAASELLYVQNRISNTLVVVDTAANAKLLETPIGSVDPRPQVIREGRGFLYDARLSGNGTVSCASCHVDSDTDNLGWDLGDPSGTMQVVTDPVTGTPFAMHPMKGPMVTQSMRGLAGTGPFHWRGDRADLSAFNPAFDKLMGGAQLAPNDLQLLSDYVDSIRLHPNPNLQPDRSFAPTVQGGNPAQGLIDFQTPGFGGGNPNNSCSTCHSLPNQLVERIVKQGPFVFPMNVPNFRGYYKKSHFRLGFNQNTTIGFGLEHDGTVQAAFLPGGLVGSITAFFLSFDNENAPIIGFERSMNSANAFSSNMVNTLSLLEARSIAGDCDLVVTLIVDDERRGFRFDTGSTLYLPDDIDESGKTRLELQSLAQFGSSLHLLATGPSDGPRYATDADLDGILDHDELDAFEVHDAGCVGTGGFTPTLSGFGNPSASGVIRVTLDEALGGSIAVLLLGLGHGSLPINGSCALSIGPLVPSIAITVPLSGAGAGGGSLSITTAIPANVNPYTIELQCVVADRLGPGGVAVSNALTIRG